MYIDVHVHLRDFQKQRHKETIKHGLEVAADSGLDAVFDMPNTDPAVMNGEIVKERLKLAKEAAVSQVCYSTYIGLTADPEQVKKAVDVHRKYFPCVIGMKLYAGHSVGQLGVIRVEDQLNVYGTLAREGYDGVLAVHAEKESELNPKAWEPTTPVSHCLARPEKAEIESVKDQLNLAYYTKCRAKLHIAHISAPAAVLLVKEAKEKRRMNVSCGVCPHHFVYDMEQMFQSNGLLWKMNPPLRKPGDPQIMLEYLRHEDIDWIETDHAPHALAEKEGEPWMSGIPGLPWWNLFEEYLRHNDFPDSLIEKVTFSNIVDRFGIGIARTKRPIKDRRADYAFNPYVSLEQQLNWKP